MSRVEMRAFIRERAAVHGFDAVGFARAPGPEEPFVEGERFLTWLGRGYAGGMTYLGRNASRRSRPEEMLSDLASVVALAKCYPGEATEPGAGEGRVARYARGRDYHNVLGRRARKLLRDTLLAFPGESGYGFVDRGAVLEKAWAVRAGLGWLGKNTLLLHPERGSYTLLAVLFLTADLAPDPIVADQCGACRLCLDACPTGAFPEPYVLDARRCISYLTIEERGAIPESLRELLGDRIFGCDVCQEVCPWNLRAAAPLDPAFGHEGTPLHEPIAAVLGLDADGFVTLTRGRPLARPGREGLLRNACVAAGNARDPAHRPELEVLAAGGSDLVREHAAWALARLAPDGTAKAAAADAIPDPAVNPARGARAGG